jgi:hypothetical protein
MASFRLFAGAILAIQTIGSDFGDKELALLSLSDSVHTQPLLTMTGYEAYLTELTKRMGATPVGTEFWGNAMFTGKWEAPAGISKDLPLEEQAQLECLSRNKTETVGRCCSALQPSIDHRLCFGATLYAHHCNSMQLEDVHQQWVANTPPPLGKRLTAVDIAKLLQNRVIMFYGESTVQQLMDSFLKSLLAYGIDTPGHHEASRKWKIPKEKMDHDANTLNEEVYIKQFNLTLRIAVAYNHEVSPILFENAYQGESGGADADVIIALLGSHYNWSPGQKHGSSGLTRDLGQLRDDLHGWQMNASTDGKRVAFVMEHWTQHFDNWHYKTFNNTFSREVEAERRFGSCAPFKGTPNQFRHGAFESTFETPEMSPIYLPTANLFMGRWMNHPGSRKGNISPDCTHYCWFRQFWEPVWERVAVSLLLRGVTSAKEPAEQPTAGIIRLKPRK